MSAEVLHFRAMDGQAGAIRYLPSVAKALEVILWLANRRRGIDIYHIAKAAFYADKHHITAWGRPIIGDDYRAAWFGPLPQVIYGLLRHQPMELLALGHNGPLPFKIDERFCVFPDREANVAQLSQSDIQALEKGFEEVDGKTFDELYVASHHEPAYRRAQSGAMDYRDFIPDDDPARKDKTDYLEEMAPLAVL